MGDATKARTFVERFVATVDYAWTVLVHGPRRTPPTMDHRGLALPMGIPQA